MILVDILTFWTNVNYLLIQTNNLIQKTTCQSYLMFKKNESYDVKKMIKPMAYGAKFIFLISNKTL